MCFSAGVSFGASALLVGTGVLAIKKAELPKQLPFASIPLLFGLQQFSEGLLWLSMRNPELVSWQDFSIYFFILFAHVIWPIWVPFAVWLMEPDKKRKRLISIFCGMGLLVASYVIYCLFTYEVSIVAGARHIQYQLEFPYMWLRRSFYIPAIFVPFFLSSLKRMKPLGATLLISLILSMVFFKAFVVSVWCFFAAILSAYILFIILKNRKPRRKGRHQGRPDYYRRPTRDFTQYTKDYEEKYWNRETAFDWQQDVDANLRQHLNSLSPNELSRIAFMVLPMVSANIEQKMFHIRERGLPVDEDALRDIAECIPFEARVTHEASAMLAPLTKRQLSLFSLEDKVDILEHELLNRHEEQRLGLVKKGVTVRQVETAEQRREQASEISRLKRRITETRSELEQLRGKYKTEEERLKAESRKKLQRIEPEVLAELEETREVILKTLASGHLPEDDETLSLIKELILKRQLRALKDISNHALVVEQSAIAPLTMGIIHYKRHREIQEAMTTFISDEAKHSSTFRRYLAEKLEAKEFVSEILLKGANRYMWIARIMPGMGMFLAVIVEAIGAAYLEFFGNEKYMPEKLFHHISKTISQQDEKRHLDICTGIYNELYRTGSRWERFRNRLGLVGLLKSVYGDKTEDHHLIQAFRAFGVEADTLYGYITKRLSQELARVGVYIEPEKLLKVIGKD